MCAHTELGRGEERAWRKGRRVGEMRGWELTWFSRLKFPGPGKHREETI